MKLDPKNPIVRFFIPRYNEISLFLMSFSFILLFFTDAELRAGCYGLYHDSRFDPRIYLVLGLFVTGILFSLYHVFTNRQKSGLEKLAMLFFAVIVSGLTGIAAGTHMLKDSHGFLILFPVWNIINGGLLILMYRYHIINESNIVDDNATPLQVVIGSVVVIAGLYVSRFFYQMYWATTFSICVSYATNISGTVQNFFSGPRNSNVRKKLGGRLKYWPASAPKGGQYK